MKASLLSAHDVGGLSGVLLRARIRQKQTHKFYENPANKYDGNTALAAMIGMFFDFTAVMLLLTSSSLRNAVFLANSLDLSVTGDFLFFSLAWGALIVLITCTVLLTYYFIDTGAPLVRRFGADELQRAREEIEL